MTSLISKDEPLKSSMVHLGYLILKRLDKAEDGLLGLAVIPRRQWIRGAGDAAGECQCAEDRGGEVLNA
mgnify:CR=1 FL=1